MEKAAAVTGSRWEVSSLVRCAAAALVSCAAGSGWTQDAAPASAWAEASSVEIRSEQQQQQAVRFEVNASALPRLDSQDTGFQAPRVDLTVLSSSSSRPGSGVGVAFGMSGFANRNPAVAAGSPTLRPVVDLGLTFRHALQNNGRIDITAWRRMNGDDDAISMIEERQPVYGARVEMRITPANRTSLKIDRGFLGLQMESGARISIKRRNGGPMIYYRNSF